MSKEYDYSKLGNVFRVGYGTTNNSRKVYSEEEINRIHTRNETLIKKYYNDAIRDYLNRFSNYSINVIEIKPYEKVLIVDNKSIFFFAINHKYLVANSIQEWFKENDIVALEYEIVIQTLIENNSLIQHTSTSSSDYTRCVRHIGLPENLINLEQYLVEIRHSRENYFEYVNDTTPELKLFDRYYENQKNRTIDNNANLDAAINLYNTVLSFYIDYHDDYSIKTYSINGYENVLVFEDTFIIYIGLKGSRFGLFGDSHDSESIQNDYEIVLQELNNNELFKFNQTKFYDKLNKLINFSILVIYKVFDGNIDSPVYKNYSNCGIQIQHQSNFDYVNNKLPFLKLNDRYEQWEGWLYYYIVYELESNGKKGYLVTHTTSSTPSSYAKTYEKKIEEALLLKWAFNKRYNHGLVATGSNELKHSFDAHFEELYYYYLTAPRDSNSKPKDIFAKLSGIVKYYIIPQYIKDKNLIGTKQLEVLTKASAGEYANNESYLFEISDYKWKSEEAVYKCVKRLFKNKNVIHQYRPYFLRSEKGQLSYDVYVCGLDIAFEYQGKQHFEPVEIFGGEENYLKQVERDNLKRKLSEENGVTLIYINYWEDVTTDLIKSKIEESKN